MVSQISVVSIQSVPGTETTDGEMAKLVRMRSPPMIADAGTLRAFPICEHPCSAEKQGLPIPKF